MNYPVNITNWKFSLSNTNTCLFWITSLIARMVGLDRFTFLYLILHFWKWNVKIFMNIIWTSSKHIFFHQNNSYLINKLFILSLCKSPNKLFFFIIIWISLKDPVFHQYDSYITNITCFSSLCFLYGHPISSFSPLWILLHKIMFFGHYYDHASQK